MYFGSHHKATVNSNKRQRIHVELPKTKKRKQCFACQILQTFTPLGYQKLLKCINQPCLKGKKCSQKVIQGYKITNKSTSSRFKKRKGYLTELTCLLLFDSVKNELATKNTGTRKN